MNKIIAIICALLFNCITGVFGAVALGVPPVAGAVAMNGLSAVSSLFGLMPSGVARAGVFTEVWTGHMIKAFRQDPEGLGWYAKIKSYDQYANNDVIHFVDIGGDPTVLVNNTSYPLQIEDLQDGDKAISLDKYQTLPTRVTDDELYAISYDKMGSVIERHKEVMQEKKYVRALHAISPFNNSAKTPVLKTTGATVDGRKQITRKDIIALKKAFDDLKVPKGTRVLVLCNEHVADLLEIDQKFADQYHNYTTGRISNLYGFDIYEFDDTPHYDVDALQKVAYGQIPGARDACASVAFSTARMMKAHGSVKFYHKEAATNPESQENLVNFRAYSICLPLRNEAMGAIVSDLA